MLPPYFSDCHAREKKHQKKQKKTKVRKGEGVTQMMLHSWIHCTVFIMFSFLSDIYALAPLKTLPLLSLYSFFGSNISALNGGGVE